MINLKGISARMFAGGAILSVWCVIAIIIFELLGIKEHWPAFLVCVLFFLTGANPKSLISIVPGGVAGLLYAKATEPFGNLIATIVNNEQLGILLAVFTFIAVGIALMEFIPAIFNNYLMLFWLVAMTFRENQHTLTWVLTAILGGAFVIGGLLIILRLLGVKHGEEHSAQG